MKLIRLLLVIIAVLAVLAIATSCVQQPYNKKQMEKTAKLHRQCPPNHPYKGILPWQ